MRMEHKENNNNKKQKEKKEEVRSFHYSFILANLFVVVYEAKKAELIIAIFVYEIMLIFISVFSFHILT